jgi:multisubunit Na+/H+ antiporter MnhB subunit
MNNRIITAIIIFFTAFSTSNYLEKDFPPEFLDLLATPIGQFMTLLAIYYLIYKDDIQNKKIPYEYVIYDTIIGMIVLVVSKQLLTIVYA